MSLITELRSVVAIFGTCILAAVVYGIVHDQVTARVCIEYFTIGHPRLFATESPTLLGVGWGIVATWWVGFILACPMAYVARVGKQPPIDAVQLVRPIAVLLVAMAIFAAYAAAVGRVLAQNGTLQLESVLAARVPPHRHVAFLAVACAHSASYFAGFVGGAMLIVQTWWRRRLLAAGFGARTKNV